MGTYHWASLPQSHCLFRFSSVPVGRGRAGALPQSHCLFLFALKLPKLHKSNFLFREFPFEARERVVLITRDALNTRYPSFFQVCQYGNMSLQSPILAQQQSLSH